MTKEIGLKNRANGQAFEYRRLKKLKKGCLVACRSSGSHGLFDLWGLQETKLRMVSCKRNGYIPPDERNEMIEFMSKKPEWVQVEVHIQISPKKTRKFIIKHPSQLAKFNKKIGTIN